MWNFVQKRWFRAIGLAAIATTLSAALVAQGDAKDQLLKKLNEQFAPTKFTADKSGIVKEGVVVALKEDGLLVYTVAVPMAPISVPKKGKLTQGFGDTFTAGMVDGPKVQGGATAIPKKTLVTGEKVWVQAIELAKDSIRVQVVTDPYDDGRYFATLKFLIPNGTVPTPEDGVKMISEVLEVQSAPAPGTSPAPAVAVEPAPAPAPMPAIAPPPPPADAPPPTIEIGQTKDQVVAGFGQPLKVANVGGKSIFYYKDMKVTFTNGKVSNVE
ncbi:MAG: hypothetical protein WCE75_07315 [Terracidiphilus sp.]